MNAELFAERAAYHDELENEVMGIIRPFTTRRHLPDKWVSFNNKLCAWDLKTSIHVEEDAHDEYHRLVVEDGVPMFIVYDRNRPEHEWYADWVQRLTWKGPYPPSSNSTANDPYYKISGGVPLAEFLQQAREL